MVLPLSLTLVTDAFPPADRGRAMGIWAAVSSVALTLGPVIGGVLAGIDWRLIFWANIPLAIGGCALTSWAASNVRDPEASPRVDVRGVLLLGAGLASLTLGLVEAEGWGWTSAATLGLIAGGLALLGGFYLAERSTDDPIVDFTLFRNKPYLGTSAAAFGLVGAFWVVMFFEPQYLQDVLGYSAAEAGLLILPITLPMVVLSPVIDRLVQAVGPPLVISVGMMLGVAGLVVMGRIDAGTDYGSLLVGFLLFGLALGFVYSPMQAAAMAAMAQAKAGVAAGVLAMNRVMAGALGLALTGSIFNALLRERIQAEVGAAGPLSERDAGELEGLAAGIPSAQAQLADQPDGVAAAVTRGVEEAFSFALSNTLWIPAGIAAVGSALAWALIRDPEEVAEGRGGGEDVHTSGPDGPAEPPDRHRHRGRFHF